MSSCIKIKKGFNLPLKGAAPMEASGSVTPATIALCPDDFPGFTPKVLIKEGEEIIASQPVLADKFNADVCLTSPVCGTVEAIVRGSRRKIERVVIKPAKGEDAVRFNLGNGSREELMKVLAQSGLLAYMRTRPYDVVPSPDIAPRDIFITAFDSAPLAPDLISYAGKHKELQSGVYVLDKLTDGNVYICVPEGRTLGLHGAKEICFKGPHPAGNSGVQINHIAPINKGDTVWTLDVVTLGRIGRLSITGVMDFNTVVAVTGPEVETPTMLKTVVGCDIQSLLAGRLKEDGINKRYISGNVLTGCRIAVDGYLRFPYRQITVIAEGDDRDEFMGWASLSPNKMSINRTFPSAFLPKRKLETDALLHGGKRAMIMSGVYDKLIPMDILPEPLIKAILARDIPRMEALGIYEVAPEDFALAEWADPSKLELQSIVRQGLDFMRKEA